MNRLASMVLLLLFAAATVSAQSQLAIQVNFTDKNHTPYLLTSPLDYISTRSLLRRYNQSLPIDSTDLPVNRTYIDSVLTLTGGVFHEASKWKNLMVVLVTDTAPSDTAGMFAAINSLPFVSSCKIIGFYGGAGLHHRHREPGNTAGNNVAARTTSDDTYFSATWGQTQEVNGNCLSDLGYKGAGKLIAILDAGFVGVNSCPYGFDSLRNSGRIVDSFDFSYHGSVYADDNHGTMVLSTMAAYVPDTFVGSAPLAQYALYITEIDPTEQPMELVNLLCGAERADSIGADILTCSLGYNTFDNPSYNFDFGTDFDGKTTIAAQAANMATKKGMLFVASAGNEGGDSWNNILTPGDADSALTVGSTNPYGSVVASSGYGPNAAGNVKPDVCAVGQPANVIDGYSYSIGSGTSFSTPQITGWAAALWQAHPSATPYLLRKAIDSCASIHATPDNHLGYGIADFCCSNNALHVSELSLYQDDLWLEPNPCQEQLVINLSVPNSQIVNFRVLDITGRQIATLAQVAIPGQVNRFSLNTGTFAAGIYLLEARTADKKIVARFVRE